MLKLGIYKHYKNHQEYKIVCMALLEADFKTQLVIYQGLYDDNPIYARPLESFVEILEIEGVQIPRFEFLREQE